MTIAIPTATQVGTFVSNVEAAVQTITGPNTTLSQDALAVLPVAGNILDAFFPGLTLLGVSPGGIIQTITSLATAGAGGPQTPLTAAFAEIKAAADGDPAPLDAAWTQYNALADQAHADWKAALAAAA